MRRKTQQDLCNQVARIIRRSFPLYDTDSSIHSVMAALHQKLPYGFDLEDSIVRAAIDEIKGRLAKNHEVVCRIQDLQRNHPEFNWHTANLLLVLNYGADYTEAGLEYALAQVADQLERSPEYHAQVAADNRAKKDVADAEALRAEFLETYQTKGKAIYLRNSGGNHAGWNFELAKEIKRLANLTVEQLREIKAKKEAKAQLEAQVETNIAQRKAAKFNGATQQVGGTASEYAAYPKLPPGFYPRGSLTMVPYDRATLTQIASQDPEFFTSLRQKYGAEQIAARMEGN